MKKGLSRRNLFKYMAAGGATVAVASCKQAPEKLIPLLVPPVEFEYKPHDAFSYMTTCQECPAGCGMMVTAREARAQKAEGNPNHPLNKGSLCARGQASMQTLYNPNRIATPMDKSGKTISWDEALQKTAAAIKGASGAVVYLSKPAAGSEGEFIDQFLAAAGGGKRVNFQLFSNANLRKANQIAFNRNELPVYEFDKAKFLLNFGADFLETWGNPNESARKFAEMHFFKEGRKNKYVHASPQVGLTGSNADEWLPILPGTEGILALSVAQVIQAANGAMPNLKGYLADYAPEKVASQIGTTAEKITKLAKEMQANSPSLAIGGGNLTATDQGTTTLVAVNVLNAVAGNIGKTVRFTEGTETEEVSHAAVSQLISDLGAGKVKVLIVDNVNTVYAIPKKSGFVEALKNTTVISLSETKNETTAISEIVLPTLTAYESWGDSKPRAGIHSLIQPVMTPVNVFDARAKGNILIALNKALATGKMEGINSYLDHIKAVWKTVHEGSGSSASFEEFWIESLEKGGFFKDAATATVTLDAKVVDHKPKAPNFEGDKDGLTLLPIAHMMHYDGSGANKPWLQEVPNPMSQIVWDSWIEINPETARKMKIEDRDVIEVSTPHGKVLGTAFYHFGIHRGAIAIPVGQGHSKSGTVADGFGVNVLDLLPLTTDKTSGEMVFVGVKAKVAVTKIKSYTVNLDGSPRQAGRGIAGAITVDAMIHPTPHAVHKKPAELLDFYPPRAETAGYYQPYRWGMVIDLDRCNGCSACVVACYAENNLAVVGKERTGMGREMSWIRLERYIEGYGDDFQVRFVPMTCQHCGNAGCETVCPVYATYHTPEGLNAQVYNRCVGTRYCSNNCAYKVRRFNWFNYEFPAPLNQQLNSTITTRMMGVMEKCTFCVHRIREAQAEARVLNRDVQDGDMVTACQQTCPTNAITFGNLADKNSNVSKMAKRGEGEHRDRQYEILDDLNFKPGITYMKKVVLRDAGEKHGKSSHA